MTSLFLLKYPEGKPATAALQATNASQCPKVPPGKGKRIHDDAQHLASRHPGMMILTQAVQVAQMEPPYFVSDIRAVRTISRSCKISFSLIQGLISRDR
jgi:hypothetical protein